MEKKKYHNKEKISKDDVDQEKHLPHDLIIEQVLTCLPIKYLTQSKLICKDWFSSISCPKFILNHYHNSVFSHPFAPLECLIIQSGYNSFYLYRSDDHDHNHVHLEVCSKNNNNNHPVCSNQVGSGNLVISSKNNNNPVSPNEVGSRNLVKLDVNFDVDAREKITLIGSSNGLVCLGENFGIYFILWNPSTNEYHKHYSLDYDLIISSTYRQFVNWGFGYVSSLDDYKVVRIMRFWNGDFVAVHVFSLRFNAWKKVEFGYADCFLQCGRARLVSETLYWILCNFDRTKKVVGFNLVFERFMIYPYLEISSSNDRLCVMGGCLSKCSSYTRNDLVMDIVKYGGRVVSVRFECDSINLVDCDELIGFTKSGKVFVMNDRLRVLYLFDTNSKELLVTFKEPHGLIRIDSYAPSQVSPFPEVETSNPVRQVRRNPF